MTMMMMIMMINSPTVAKMVLFKNLKISKVQILDFSGF